MKRLLIRADDLGYSYAVNLGIARCVREGLVRSVGMMPNMPEAARGWNWIADADIAIGQHANMCLGTPCANPERIPSLVDENGKLKSSNTYRTAFKAGEDFVVVKEAVIEIEAQLARFRKIVGRDPDYFEAHAVASNNLFVALHQVAEAHGLREQTLSFNPAVPPTFGGTPVHVALQSMCEDYEPEAFIREVVANATDGETVVFVGHPGYLDRYILENSSLTTNRAREVDALTSPELMSWLAAQPDLQLVDYRDL